MRPADAGSLKIVALPAEHGASVMLGESLLAGLLITASAKGLFPALGWLFLFLISTPLKIALKDISRHIFTARTSLALWCCAGFGILALAFFVTTYFFCGISSLIVLVGVMPLGMTHLWAVVNAGKKEFIAELSGALSLGAAASSILLAAGHSWQQALALWLVLAVRAMTTVIYVRERLSQSRANINNDGLVFMAHIAGFAVLWALTMVHLVKPLIFIAGFLLMIRLWFMYRCYPVTAKNLGLQELVLGIVFVVLVVFAF